MLNLPVTSKWMAYQEKQLELICKFKFVTFNSLSILQFLNHYLQTDIFYNI